MILLNQIKIASPCHASWDEMTGDAQVRFCGHCQKNVYNLSEMTRKDAQNLLAKSGAPPCVRFYKRADGTMLTQDCPVGKRRLKKRNAAVSYAALAAPLVLLTNGVPLKFSPPAIPPASATMGAPPVPLLGKIAAPSSGARGKPVLPPKKAKGASKKTGNLDGKTHRENAEIKVPTRQSLLDNGKPRGNAGTQSDRACFQWTHWIWQPRRRKCDSVNIKKPPANFLAGGFFFEF